MTIQDLITSISSYIGDIHNAEWFYDVKEYIDGELPKAEGLENEEKMEIINCFANLTSKENNLETREEILNRLRTYANHYNISLVQN